MFVCMRYRIDEFSGNVIFKKGTYDDEEEIKFLIRKNLDVSDDTDVELMGEGPWELTRPWSVDRTTFWAGQEKGESK